MASQFLSRQAKSFHMSPRGKPKTVLKLRHTRSWEWKRFNGTPTSSGGEEEGPFAMDGDGADSEPATCYSSIRPRMKAWKCLCDNEDLEGAVEAPPDAAVQFHALFHGCATCQARPADLLCMWCWKGFCHAHGEEHFKELGHRVCISYQLSSYETIFWCFKCQAYLILENYDHVLELLCDSKGTYAAAPITDKHSCCHASARVRILATIMQGWRATQEDAYIFLPRMNGNGFAMSAVFDGHGGSLVSEYCADNYHDILVEELTNKGRLDNTEDIVAALVASFLETDRQLKDEGEREDVGACGSTALVVLVTNAFMFCANAGDCRAVLCRGRVAINLSDDHSPDRPDERERCLKAGAAIYQDGRIDGILSVSRAIGDFDFKQNGRLPAEEQAVTAMPEVTVQKVHPEDRFIVLASDGVWNCKTSQEVVTHLVDALEAGRTEEEAVNSLLDSCVAAEVETGTGTDNMTLVLMRLLHPAAPASSPRRSPSVPYRFEVPWVNS